MTTPRWSMRKLLAASALAWLIVMGGSPLHGLANDTVVIADPMPEGATLTVSAAGEIDPSSDFRLLMLEGLFISNCTAGEISHEYGPILVFAESYEVTVRFTAGGQKVDRLLPQGESVVVPADTPFTLINSMVDSAYPAEVILLIGTKANPASATKAPFEPVVTLAASLDRWPEKSSCQSISTSAKLQPTFKVSGAAGTAASRLYLGIGIWEPGATTKGYEITDEASSLNLMILTGGMDNAGLGTGRAFHAGPRQVLTDAYDELLSHEPFANSGAAPVVGLIFGTALIDSSVLVEAT
jgi:hypothetical protein